MPFSMKGRIATAAVVGVAGFGLMSPALAAPDGQTGPSSSDAPYQVRELPGVTLASILTAGDSVGGYRMAGVPDGLGAFDNGDGTFTVLMGHELTNAQGGPRSHGNTNGSFISRWVVDKNSLKVLSGRDQITNLITSGSKNLDRLCSADLPAVSAFYNAKTGLGFNGRILTDGEETAGGRAFGHVVDTGDSYELTALGKAEWENVVANSATGDRTVVVGQADGGSQRVFVYAGTKQATGNPVEKAGLTNGVVKSIAVQGFATESGAADFPSAPQPFTLSDTGTSFDRPEDGAWDPTNPNAYYFVTTASMTKHSRLWRLDFVDASKPELGGTITKVLEGPATDSPNSTGPMMMDNITVNDRGQVLIQEDPGNNLYRSGIFQYDPKTGGIQRITVHDPDRFTPGGPVFDTIDEESSGIIPAPFLGEGKYLFDVQNHAAVSDPTVVQKGQLLVLRVPPGKKVR